MPSIIVGFQLKRFYQDFRKLLRYISPLATCLIKNYRLFHSFQEVR